MATKVLHSSDIHGSYKWLIRDNVDTDFDVWVDTGDFFPNAGRRRGGGTIVPELEQRYQRKWMGWKSLAERLRTWLAGRPALLMPGNHDFISLAAELRRARCPNVYSVPCEGIDVLGLRWAGFRHINAMGAGEWAGELLPHEFEPWVAKTAQAQPDVLVTHSPPQGILDGTDNHDGVGQLTEGFERGVLRPRVHLFGHAHACAGEEVTMHGIRFYNGACGTKLLQIPAPATSE